MKWIFLLLVVANAGFFAWQGFSAADDGVAQTSIYGPPVSEKIYLVAEERPDDSFLEPLTESLSVSDEQQPTLLDTLNEAVEESIEAQQTPLAPEESLLCPAIALEREAGRNTVAALLDSNGIAYTASDNTGLRDKYWLYIEAPSTQSEAQDIVSRLKLKRIDSYVISTGEMKNRISLGLFSSEERAKQAQTNIMERSRMPVKVYRHQRTVSLYELLLDQPITETRWQEIEDQLDFSKLLIKIEKNPC